MGDSVSQRFQKAITFTNISAGRIVESTYKFPTPFDKTPLVSCEIAGTAYTKAIGQCQAFVSSASKTEINIVLINGSSETINTTVRVQAWL